MSAQREDPRPLRVALVVVMVVGLIALGFYCYGFGSGGLFYFKLVRDPFAAAKDAPYYRGSLLHVAVGHMLGLGRSIIAFRLMVLGCFWAALGYVAAVVRRRLSKLDLGLVLAVMLLHPSGMIVYAWTCHPDAVTCLLTMVLLFSRRRWVVAVVAALGAWNHLAMWTVVCINAAALWWALAETGARARALAMAGGLVVGAVTLKLTLWLCGVEIASDRLALAAAQDVGTLAGYWTHAGWPILYTLYFAHLLWLPVLVRQLWQRRGRAALVFVGTQLLALAAAFVTQDTTRVFAVLAWGPLVYCLVDVLAEGSEGRRGLRPVIAVALVVTLFGPKIFAWKGEIRDTQGARAQLRGLLF